MFYCTFVLQTASLCGRPMLCCDLSYFKNIYIWNKYTISSATWTRLLTRSAKSGRETAFESLSTEFYERTHRPIDKEKGYIEAYKWSLLIFWIVQKYWELYNWCGGSFAEFGGLFAGFLFVFVLDKYKFKYRV